MAEAIKEYQELKKSGKLADNSCLVCAEGNYCIVTIEEAKKEGFYIVCI